MGMSNTKKVCVGAFVIIVVVVNVVTFMTIETTTPNETIQRKSLSYESSAYIGKTIRLFDEVEKLANFINNSSDISGANTTMIRVAAQNILEARCPQDIAPLGQVANTFANQAVACDKAKFSGNRDAFLQNVNVLFQQARYVGESIDKVRR